MKYVTVKLSYFNILLNRVFSADRLQIWDPGFLEVSRNEQTGERPAAPICLNVLGFSRHWTGQLK